MEMFYYLADRFAALLALGILTVAPLTYILVHHRTKEGLSGFADGEANLRFLKDMAYWFLRPCHDWLVSRGTSPDSLSYAGLGLAAGAGLAMATGATGFAALLLLLSALCDVADGMVARTRGVSSDSGAVLDSFLDRSSDIFYCAGLLWLWQGQWFLFLVVLAAINGSVLYTYTTALGEKYSVNLPRYIMSRAERVPVIVVGGLFSAFSMPLESSYALPDASPLLLAMLIIALGANWAAIARLRILRRELA